MSQLLEFFGMTPTVPSEYLNSEGGNEGKTQAQPMWLCKSCHNPTEWIEAEERWQCPSHPKASTFEKS